MSNKALFLDRDGIINEDVGYPHKPEQIKFVQGVFHLCEVAQKKGYLIIIITNQAGVAHGYFTEEDVAKLHEWIRDQFEQMGIHITGSYYCPYHPNAKLDQYRCKSEFRKPAPGMILMAAMEHAIDLKSSIMVGDKPSDRINHPDIRSIIVKSRYSVESYDVEELSEIEAML